MSIHFTLRYEDIQMYVGKELVFKGAKRNCKILVSHTSKTGKRSLIIRGGKRLLAYRYLWQEKFGPIPDGLILRHKCDNPLCVNLNHLELGVRADNSRDRVSRGRSLKGELQPNSKLTNQIVKEIKRDKRTAGKELAKQYKCSPSTISMIRSGASWKHI